MINRSAIPRLEEVLKSFDIHLSTLTWPFVAGTHRVTIADISLYFSWTLLEVATEIDTSVYHAIQGWCRNVQEDALKSINDDRLFDEARENLKDWATQAMQGIKVF